MMHISFPASPGNNAFSSSLEWIARYKLSIPGILHSLDDFLIIDQIQLRVQLNFVVRENL